MKRIRIDKPRIRREHPWPEGLPVDPRDPDVVRVKALARSQLTGSSRSNRTQQVNTMHPYMIELLARQREAELRRSALRHGPPVPRRRRGRRRSVRHRAGWALVAIGLTLAHGLGDA